MSYSRRRFTRAEVYRMVAADVFLGERFQLIAGELYTDPVLDNFQALGMSFLRESLQAAFGPDFWVRTRATLDLADDFVPDPHVAVVAGGLYSWRGRDANPTTALLVVEVPVTELAFVRDTKAQLYAAAGIQDFWVFNVHESRLEVYRDPRPDATREFGAGYTSLRTLRAGDTVSPLAEPEAAVISTRDLSALPDIDALRRLLQSMAMLDAILCPDWQNRYYSFNAGWSAGEQMGSMRNGSGDEFSAHFSPAGCWLKGFAHEADMLSWRADPPVPWPGVYDAVPAEFAECLREPAFSTENVTFCVWRRYADSTWQVGPIAFPPDDPDPDGSAYLLSILDGRPESYAEWAAGYYGQDVDLDAVRHVYAHRPLTADVAARLNPDLSMDDLEEDMAEIGYPEPR